jgi:hypothetical protein
VFEDRTFSIAYLPIFVILTSLVYGIPSAWADASKTGGVSRGSPSSGQLQPQLTPVLRVSGSPQKVFQWATARCADTMIPDAPARAFRPSPGKVELFATSSENWSLVGPSLDKLKPQCKSAFIGGEKPQEDAFDDRAWIEAVYKIDSSSVIAVISDEWDAYRHPRNMGVAQKNCNTAQYQRYCMFYSINYALSSDNGASFSYKSPGRGHVIIEPPVSPEAMVASAQNKKLGPWGFQTISNIVKKDDFYYMFSYTAGGFDQKGGNCLLRTSNLVDPQSWRAWDGSAFSIAMTHTEKPGTVSQPCSPVSPSVLSWDLRSVVWSTRWKTFVGVMLAASVDASGRRISGLYYTFSNDLIHWTPKELLTEAASTLDGSCRPPIHYPSLLDPESASENFETTADTMYVYYTEFNLTGCKISLNRDLVRIPVKLTGGN